MAARAREGWVTVTELADTLTREHDMPFKAAHRIAAAFVVEATRRPHESRADILKEISSSIGRAIAYDEDRISEILSPDYFVRVRKTPGGPAPEEVRGALARSQERMKDDERWTNERVDGLRRAEERLNAALAAL
jgi:argininosuccinate lyase